MIRAHFIIRDVTSRGGGWAASLGIGPPASACGTSLNRADPTTLSGWYVAWVQRPPRPLNLRTTLEKIPVAAPGLTRAIFETSSTATCKGLLEGAAGSFVKAALRSRCGHYIFLPCVFSSPNLGRRRLDVYRTSTHDVALARI